MTLDVVDAIKGRRSIRSFDSSRDVSDEVIEKLIEAATWAPSAGNIQPWEFIIVRNSEAKRRLAEAAFGQSFLAEAPVVVVVCADENRSGARYDERGRALYCLQDTAAAVQNIHLSAYAMGLGTCWIGAFNEEKAASVVEVSDGVRPVAMIPVGYALKPASIPGRRPVNQVVHREVFRVR